MEPNGQGKVKQILTPLLDQHGKLIPHRKSLIDRCKVLSRKTKIVVASVVALLGCFAAILTNVQTIQNFYKPEALPPTVPPIVVEISNSSGTPVDIVPRGDFFLWLPGPGTNHTIGKYELRGIKSNTTDLEIITVNPSEKIRMLAHVMNQKFIWKNPRTS